MKNSIRSGGSIKNILISGVLAVMSMVTVSAQAEVTLALEAECTGDLGGLVLGEQCVSTVVTVGAPVSMTLRAAGKSGRSWTASGNVVETITSTYELGSTTTPLTTTSTVSVLIPAGTPNFQGCDTSGTKPAKCFDRYVDQEVTSTVYTTTYFWQLSSSLITYEDVYTTCRNPGGQIELNTDQCGF